MFVRREKKENNTIWKDKNSGPFAHRKQHFFMSRDLALTNVDYLIWVLFLWEREDGQPYHYGFLLGEGRSEIYDKTR